MKLKLESKDSITVLRVTEKVAPEHFSVLKAGLSKLHQSGKTSFIVDFGNLTEKDFLPSTIISDFDGLSHWATESGFDLLSVSSFENLGEFRTIEPAIEAITSPHSKLLIEEALLKTEIRQLQSRRSGLESRLSSLQSEEKGIRALKKEQSMIQASISTLEKQAGKTLARISKRKNPVLSTEIRDKLASTINPILTQRKIIIGSPEGTP